MLDAAIRSEEENGYGIDEERMNALHEVARSHDETVIEAEGIDLRFTIDALFSYRNRAASRAEYVAIVELESTISTALGTSAISMHVRCHSAGQSISLRRGTPGIKYDMSEASSDAECFYCAGIGEALRHGHTLS
ncbi:hypothetical protein GCM10009760_25740 [Kitasatospora kazusensis]|uniref:Uncharacterized protein n=1 Tax=Kitasatospora kazusensis TaxID=407974 RepID=A0ABN2ZFK7_9ACTN